MELTQSRNHDRPLWTRSGDVVFDGGYAVWFTDDLIQLAVADLCRMLLFSAGFFAAHSVASSWIGPRAKRAKGQASSLYLFSYYLGSSIAGTLGGVFWHNYGWNGVGAFIALMLVIALLVGTRLHHRLHA